MLYRVVTILLLVGSVNAADLSSTNNIKAPGAATADGTVGFGREADGDLYLKDPNAGTITLSEIGTATDFSDLTGTATDAQIPNSLTLNYIENTNETIFLYRSVLILIFHQK